MELMVTEVAPNILAESWHRKFDMSYREENGLLFVASGGQGLRIYAVDETGVVTFVSEWDHPDNNGDDQYRHMVTALSTEYVEIEGVYKTVVFLTYSAPYQNQPSPDITGIYTLIVEDNGSIHYAENEQIDEI